MGVGLLGGATGTVLVTSFKSIDEQVGTNGSAAAAVLGIGIIIAAFNPTGSVAWVRAGIHTAINSDHMIGLDPDHAMNSYQPFSPCISQ